MDGNKSGKKFSPRASSKSNSLRENKDEEPSVKSTEPTTAPPGTPKRSTSSSRLANRLKATKDMLDPSGSSSKPPLPPLLTKAQSNPTGANIPHSSSNRSFNESNSELLKTLVKKSDSNEATLLLLLQEVKAMSNKNAGDLGDKRSENSSSASPHQPESSKSSSTPSPPATPLSKWVRVFSNANNRHVQINTETGEIIDECETIGNGWEVFHLPDREKVRDCV
jgi:hypothetical protein